MTLGYRSIFLFILSRNQGHLIFEENVLRTRKQYKYDNRRKKLLPGSENVTNMMEKYSYIEALQSSVKI